ncbi:hypothetical protein Sta7437_4238 [Stanieria cyanosphaera PCC 7437]|uniref:Uncharacterized protein n=1 Tax=Stanieria cyanosphaera (strain ATCC 29371 / PCC 7437) TaxID=111780 RepID=K9XZZ7_STAC7|nr:hypothetical protein [Stanieria cyanosphaera]AFZ37711.1 hypothetical protein Sta7437_4238 [Stanieria cyanosphaera PCC 7437]
MNSEQNLDNLLNELKSTYKDSDSLPPNYSSEIGNLLDEVKSELKTNKKSKEPNRNQITQAQSQVDESLDLIKQQYQQKQNLSSAKIKNTKIIQNNSQLNESFESIKAQYKNKQTHQQAQEQLNYNRNKQEIIIQEQQKQLQHKQLVQQAEQWLKNLDPNSDEGMWFNELAESYPSRLEAAISYLSTLKSI